MTGTLTPSINIDITPNLSAEKLSFPAIGSLISRIGTATSIEPGVNKYQSTSVLGTFAGQLRAYAWGSQTQVKVFHGGSYTISIGIRPLDESYTEDDWSIKPQYISKFMLKVASIKVVKRHPRISLE